MNTYELMLATGKVVTWAGSDGEDACTRYAAAHPGATVVAWRVPPHGMMPGLLPIIG